MRANRDTILIVEDDAQIRQMMQIVLEKEGFSTASVEDGESGIKTLSEFDPSLIILDVGLPGIDGFTTCQRMRLLTPAPILMVTGRTGTVDVVWGLEVGGDDYLAKPFGSQELAARVQALLRRGSGRSNASYGHPYASLAIKGEEYHS